MGEFLHSSNQNWYALISQRAHEGGARSVLPAHGDLLEYYTTYPIDLITQDHLDDLNNLEAWCQVYFRFHPSWKSVTAVRWHKQSREFRLPQHYVTVWFSRTENA